LDGPCGFTPREKYLSRVMRGFWLNLATTGDPNPAGADAAADASNSSRGAGEFRTTILDILLPSMPAVPPWPRFTANDVGTPADGAGGVRFLFDVTDYSGVGRSLPISSMTTKCALMSEVPMAYSKTKPPVPR
jgi:hypothetical protein